MGPTTVVVFFGENSGRVMVDTERKIRAESMTMVVLVEKDILQVSLVGMDFLFFFLGFEL